jgi:hypothetical protein
VFVAADNKIYDGTTAATASFFGDPTVGGTIDVGLTGGTTSFVDKNAGPAKAVTFSGYSIDGAGAGPYALFAGTGSTTAAIAPATLTLTADSTAKTYGTAITLAPTAFTAAGLQNGDTIAGLTESSAGVGASAGVAGGPYAITASNAVGGGYLASNYTTTYVPGVLTTLPVVTTPVETTMGDTTPVETTPVETTVGETTAGETTAGETPPLMTSAGTTFGELMLPVQVPAGLPLVMVDRGVRTPVFTPAAVHLVQTVPAVPYVPSAGEYPRKPDRN